MNHVTIRKTTLGVGIPKIFVPLVSKTPEELFADAAAIARTAADIVEWRADWQESIFEEGRVLNILRSLREQLGEMPLLFTFRTFPEGGNMEATGEQYKSLTATAITSGLVDMVDIELSAGEETVKELISLAKERDVKVIMSNHDFYATPSKEEMIGRLRRMEELGTDIAKIAVMPGCPEPDARRAPSPRGAVGKGCPCTESSHRPAPAPRGRAGTRLSKSLFSSLFLFWLRQSKAENRQACVTVGLRSLI